MRFTLESTGKVAFYHAVNVATDRLPNRPYRDGETVSKDGGPCTELVDAATGKVIEADSRAYGLVISKWNKVVDSRGILGATVLQQGPDSYVPLIRFSRQGARAMEAWCREFATAGEYLAFVSNGRIVNMAHLSSGAIITDTAMIAGHFDPTYVRQLVSIVNAGALPARLKILSVKDTGQVGQ